MRRRGRREQAIIYVIAGSNEEFRAWISRNAFESRNEFKYVGSFAACEGIDRASQVMLIGTWEQHKEKRQIYEYFRARGYNNLQMVEE